MADIVVTQVDNGKGLELTLDNVVVLHLPENPTTGYRWALEPNEGVSLETSNYVVAASSGVGGGGQRTFKLRPLRTGTVSVNLKRWRDWEGDTSVIERFHMSWQVR
jgi:inhibitor of cysteine peptidase